MLFEREGKWYASTFPPGVSHTGLMSNRLRGTLRSPTFEITAPAIHYLIAGDGGAKFNLIIDNFQRIRSPIYGGLTFPAQPADKLVWRRQDVKKWIGHRAYIELIDDGDGWGALAAVVQSDEPPKNVPGLTITTQPIESGPEFSAWLAERTRFDRSIRYSRPVMAITDGTPENEHILIRGNHKLLGPIAPRRIPTAIREPLWGEQYDFSSGRLELAQQIASPRNRLTARVIVNRVWKHHFGTGIVPTVDDFGHMGQPPTHPELLDYLAMEFTGDGWSLKRLHRRLLLSRAYQMSSALQPAAATLDPRNQLWHRMNVRRLEAEAIRDALLAVSGSLDDTLFGPSVLPQLTPFMDGRGRPKSSGPLDGAGRRSIYIAVRRNFLSPLFLAFDYPVPFSTIGRRTVSNVPAQALAMLNNPLVLDQAQKWARRELATPGDRPARIERMYLTALGRKPEPHELTAAEEFLAASSESARSDDPAAWTDFAQVLFNLKEFIFIP